MVNQAIEIVVSDETPALNLCGMPAPSLTRRTGFVIFSACGGRAWFKETHLNASPHDGDTGAESGIGEGHPGTLADSRADTTANEYMQELPESVQPMVGTVFALLTSATAAPTRGAGLGRYNRRS
jgi:hypothetical protein